MKTANITGAWYSSRNAGDQAILITIRELLEARIPDLRLQVICAKDDFVRSEHNMPAISQSNNLLGVLKSVAKSDALMLGGGTPFYNEFKHMCFFWGMSELCKLTGHKLIIYGASAQKLNKRYARWFTRRIMNIADLVTVREETTKEQMAAIGVRNTVHCTADPAITLKACEEQRTEEILRQEGINDTDQPIYAICPHFFSNVDKYHVHHYEKFQDDHIERQRKILSAAADYLAERGKVIFIPMNIDPPDSDVDVGREIRERTKNRENIKFIENQYRPKEIAGLYKRCRLVIGVRLHSLIMSSAVGTPVIGINYAPKVEGFMRLAEQMDHCLNLRQAEFSQLQDIIDNYLNNYDSLKTQFREKVRIIQARAENNAQMAADLLK